MAVCSIGLSCYTPVERYPTCLHPLDIAHTERTIYKLSSLWIMVSIKIIQNHFPNIKKLITLGQRLGEKQQKDEIREMEGSIKTYKYPLHFSSHRLKQNEARADTTRSSGWWNVPYRPMERAPPGRKTRENRAERSKVRVGAKNRNFWKCRQSNS